jgi:GT2 family glycosyltransferase
MPATDSGGPSVLAIVVTHNGREWLRDCLVSLATQSYSALDILVVDDASTDSRQPPGVKRIAKRHLRRRRWGYLRTPRPLGFGGAINWALGRIRTDADVLLFVHDDAALDRRALERMVARIQSDDDTAIVGPKVVSWDDPTYLEEVGMAADRFGYPYKGLEDGEIDLGQHDNATEVFYVTSTCMLVRHSVFQHVQGWDAQLRAFAEDLDLCWRFRLAGHIVKVEPLARVRHAMALATGKRSSPFIHIRYFIRRNRLRTLIKNASAIRLLALIPLFTLLSFAEMLGFIVLRQPREILSLARGLLWNMLRLPQTLTERARVQRRRKVPDRTLGRLTVRETTRMRAYLGNQAQRLEEAWGRRAELFSQRSAQATLLTQRLVGWPGLIALVSLVGIVLGFRHVLWSPPVSIGELLPFPEHPTALWRAWASPWQGSALGSGDPAPPAFAILGTVPILALGAVGAAQKLLVLGLGLLAFIGAYRLVAELVDRPGRIAAGLAYAFGAVGYAGVREGRLGTLVFGAVAPMVLGAMLRLIGWMRPPGFVPGTAVARVALGSGLSAAFVPGSLFLYALAGLMLGTSRLILDRSERAVRGLAASTIGLLLGWALLLPWSATWFGEGGPLGRLVSDETWGIYAASFRGHGIGSVLLGQTPDGPASFGLALPLLGLVAGLAGEGARRRLALALWAVVVATGLFVTAVAVGMLRPIVAAPTEAGVLAALAFAGLTGLAVGAFRLDLPRRGLGLIHALTLGVLIFCAGLVIAGLAPAMFRGDWDPGRTSGENAETVDQVTTVLSSESQRPGGFRALWVGSAWTTTDASAARPVGEHLLTGPRGQVLTDLFARSSGPADDALERVVASIEEGSTDRGGHLLAPFNMQYIVLEPGDDTSDWLRQRDLALIRSEANFLLLENRVQLPHAGLYDRLPGYVRELTVPNEAAGGGTEDEAADRILTQETAYRFEAADISGPAVAYLSEAASEGWTASVDDEELRRFTAGPGNAFAVPPGTSGDITVEYPRTTAGILWKLVFVFAWLIVIGAAFSSRRGPAPPVRRVVR